MPLTFHEPGEMAALNVLVVAALVGVDFVAVSEEGARL